MKETKKDSTIVENTYFRFQTWNTPNFQKVTKMTLFKFSKLLNLGLAQSVITEKKYTKKQLKRQLTNGILLGQITVMRLNPNPKKRYY